jgi:hypothetical protein
MRKLLVAAAASLAALALPAAPAQANHRDGVRVGLFVGSGPDWGWNRPRWRGRHWRGDWRWHAPPRRWRGHGWARSCRGWWWDGWTWRCRR